MQGLERIFDDVLGRLPKYSEESIENPAEYPNDDSFPDIFDIDRIGEIFRYPYRTDIYSEDPEKSGVEVSAIEGRVIEGAVRDIGVDALAFYKSYRFINEKPFRGEWGVFFINSGIQYVTHLIALDFPGVLEPRKLAFDFIAAHEFFHAKFDVGILGLEAVSKKHFYVPQKFAFRRCPAQQPEEALANRTAWKFLDRDPRTKFDADIKEFFELFMDRQPAAYARYKEPLVDLQSEAAAGIFSGLRYKGARDSALGKWIGHVPPYTFSANLVPRHLVTGVKYSQFVAPSLSFPTINIVSELPNLLKKYPNHHKKWADTKSKLISAPERVGLNFKRWPPKPPLWSIRVDKAFRAHLNPVSIADGVWEAVEYGTHDELGH